MSNITRNKTIITARNQFKTTKEGAIAYATKNIDLAYAHGFSDAKKSEYSNDTSIFLESIENHGLLVTAITLAEPVDKMQFVVAKDDFIESLNDKIGTNYNRDHINNYLAKRKSTPQKILAFCRHTIAKEFVSNDVAEILSAEVVTQ